MTHEITSEMTIIKPKKLQKGDTIGIIAPCSVPSEKSKESYAQIENMGFRVLRSQFLYADTNGFAASIEQRLSDLYDMVANSEVKAVLFGGGCNSNELLPYIDYSIIRQNPKIYCSFSDGTTLLNAFYAKAGIVTFCGTSPRTLAQGSVYNAESFSKAVMQTQKYEFEHNSKWQTICGGSGEGILVGGNLFVLAYLAGGAYFTGGEYFTLDNGRKYILFLEDLPGDEPVAMQSRSLHHIMQSGLINSVSGVIFGSFAPEYDEQINAILRRELTKFGIPVVRCGDFGHMANAGVLPIGVSASLDADKQVLEIMEGGVC